MACNGADQEPLLSGLVDPAPETKKTDNAPKRRRCLNGKGVLPADSVLPNPKADGIGKTLASEFTFGKLHPSLKQVGLSLAVYLGVGTVCFYIVRDELKGKKTNRLVDAIYFSVVTMTTAGYGDLHPDNFVTKLLAMVFAFMGMGMAGLVVSKGASYLVEKQEKFLVKALEMHHQKVGPNETRKEVKPTNVLRYKVLVISITLSVHVAFGTMFLASSEKLDFFEAIYCVCITIMTVGYGDDSFRSTRGRFFAVIWLLTSTFSFAQFFLKIAELYIETRQKALAEWVLTRTMTNVDLEAADHDDDGVVEAVEFTLYKLKEMGKISQEDISLVLKEFEEIDSDQSGSLSASDTKLTQPSQTEK